MADPMWRQIAEDLRLKIESGELGGGGQPLPSELELRAEYQASRNTVRDAVKWLTTRGLVETRPGRGTFVVTKIDPFVMELSAGIGAGPGAESSVYISEVGIRRRTAEVSAPRVEIHQAKGLVSDELKVTEGATVVSRHQKRYIDGTPWSLQTTFYPIRLVELGATRIIQAEDMPDGVSAYIEDTLGVVQAGWRDRFTVRAPDRAETDFFDLPDDGRIAVFEIIRTGYDDSGDPFRVTITTYPADRNVFVMNVGEVPEERRVEAPGPDG